MINPKNFSKGTKIFLVALNPLAMLFHLGDRLYQGTLGWVDLSWFGYGIWCTFFLWLYFFKPGQGR